MKESQTSLRTLWTIKSLLEGGEKNQTQIVDYINKKTDNPEINKIKPKKTNKATISHVIKYLKTKNIIDIISREVEGTNLNANYCSIPNNLKTFIKIVNEINDSQIQNKNKKYFINGLIHSQIGNKLIKPSIINTLLQKNKNQPIEFKKSEEEFITFTLKNSPQALNYTINSIQAENKEWNLENPKNYYLFKIHTLLLLDMMDNYYIQNKATNTKQLQYDSKISLKENQEMKNLLITNIKPKQFEFNLIINFNILK